MERIWTCGDIVWRAEVKEGFNGKRVVKLTRYGKKTRFIAFSESEAVDLVNNLKEVILSCTHDEEV